ncbi:hypothetical protein [Rhizobium rhizosphaerae]|uniref:hypothetical protein n=1 Tax=Xaviernesmea rhizosphaerae TaxID=1672749 RepID=UPI0015938ECF|nr:hypothetical protein [Xaviernesmea rhizosphaerae]
MVEKDPAQANSHSPDEARKQKASGRMLALFIGGVLAMALLLYLAIVAFGLSHA